MNIKQIILHKVNMRLISPFATSFGAIQAKPFFIVEAIDESGHHGFGESVAFSSPWYTEETAGTNELVMTQSLIPLLLGSAIAHPDEVTEKFTAVRRNHMAKAALEGAVWDAYAKRENMSLARALGGLKQEIEVGISIGIQQNIVRLLQTIDQFVAEGYKRVKLKIKPGWDVDMLREVRQHFPDIPLMVDANSAYTLADLDHLKALDEFHLLMIEQPLADNDFLGHAKLQSALETPICLDESIHSYADAQLAVTLGSCKIINIKIGRVGGLTEAKKIHDYCHERGIPVWCGGMLEAGIGRAHNIALTTLNQFVLPGDTAGSSRYWEKDIIQPEVVVKNGMITVPSGPGLGYEIDREALTAFTVDQQVFEV